MNFLRIYPYKIAINGVLLFVALCFSVIAIIVVYRGEIVTSAGNEFIADYTKSSSIKFTKALKNLTKGNDESAVSLLRSWSDVKMIDRLYPMKRQLFIALAKHLYARGQFSDLAKRARQWLDGDDRNIIVAAYWAASLRHERSRADEGKNILARLWTKFPNLTLLTKFYAESAADDGDKAALQRIRAAMQAGWEPDKMSDWQIFWDSGRKFNEKDSTFAAVRKEGKRWRITVQVPYGFTRLRIDPPAQSRLRITGLVYRVGGQKRSVPINLIRNYNMMTRHKEWLQTSGEIDPFFAFDTAAFWKKGGGPNTVTLIIDFYASPPQYEWFEKFAKRVHI